MRGDVPGSMGYFAHDGDTALSEVKRSMPQVVMLDLNCPPLTGWKWRVNYVRATAWPDDAETHSKAAEAGFELCAYPALQPTKFDLALNLNTAKAIDLAIPKSLLLHADEAIQ